MADINLELSHALVQAVAGEYPDSEVILSTEVQPRVITTAVEAITKERERIQAEVRLISRKVAPDVDGWIQQAKQLQVDIERSKAMAKEIVQQAEQAKVLRHRREDVSKKLVFLDDEVAFSKKLENVLGNIQLVTRQLSEGHTETAHGNLEIALERLQAVQALLAELRPVEQTTVVELLLQRAEKLRVSVAEEVKKQWDASICVDRNGSRVTLGQLSEERDHPPNLSMEIITELSSQLDVLESNIGRTCRELTSTIFRPLLEPTASSDVARISFADHEMYISTQEQRLETPAIIDEIASVVRFLNDNLPTTTSVALSECLMPPIVSRLITIWLTPSIPTSIDAVKDFNILLERTEVLVAALRRVKWAGSADLDEWVQQGPRNWLARRRELSLAATRTLLAKNVQQTKSVERIETQVVSKDDMIATNHGGADDWDADWAEETDPTSPAKPTSPEAEDEEFDAWGAAEDSPELKAAHGQMLPDADTSGANEEEGDAWGWNEHDGTSAPPSPVKERKAPPKTNGHQNQSHSSERPMTLREHYTITAVPDQIRDMIVQISRDADTLRQPEFEDSPISAASAALYSLPALIIAAFRALAPTYYSALVGSNMYLYNDSLRLASELETFASQQASQDATSTLSKSAWPSTRMKLSVDITALEKFGKRAYGKEMESQRTILRDLLDGAQGFINCTDVPFAAECDSAISMTVDRIREVSKQWTPILSRSALLQSLGSLLTMVNGKMIDDVQALPDISDAESQRLRHFFNEISKLSDLFRQINPADAADSKDMTPLYTPNWFKFQYLSEIMDSSLVDIKYLWTDADLKLEFEADELIDLIEALFADTDHRRRAIAEIRRS